MTVYTDMPMQARQVGKADTEYTLEGTSDIDSTPVYFQRRSKSGYAVLSEYKSVNVVARNSSTGKRMARASGLDANVLNFVCCG